MLTKCLIQGCKCLRFVSQRVIDSNLSPFVCICEHKSLDHQLDHQLDDGTFDRATTLHPPSTLSDVTTFDGVRRAVNGLFASSTVSSLSSNANKEYYRPSTFSSFPSKVKAKKPINDDTEPKKGSKTSEKQSSPAAKGNIHTHIYIHKCISLTLPIAATDSINFHVLEILFANTLKRGEKVRISGHDQALAVNNTTRREAVSLMIDGEYTATRVHISEEEVILHRLDNEINEDDPLTYGILVFPDAETFSVRPKVCPLLTTIVSSNTYAN